MKNRNPKFIVIIGIIFVSFSAVLIKLSSAPSLIIATYRLLFTVALILPTFLIKERISIKALSKTDLILSLISGVFLALHFATWITSIKYTSIASSTVLVNTHPIFIVIGSYFILKEKPSKRILLSMAVTLIGSILISLGDSNIGSNALYGDILAILGALFVSGYMLIGRLVRQQISTTAYTFMVYVSCSITLLLFTVISKTPLYPYPIKEFILFLSLAFFCTILGHSIFSWSLKYVNPTFLSTAVLGEPVFATIWAILFFDQIPMLWQVIGGAMVISGIYLSIQPRKHKSTLST